MYHSSLTVLVINAVNCNNSCIVLIFRSLVYPTIGFHTRQPLVVFMASVHKVSIPLYRHTSGGGHDPRVSSV